MKLKISRTSVWQQKPCDEAFKHPHEQWHVRTCTEDEFNQKFSRREGLWRDKGKNHSVRKDGCIIRQEEDEECWTVEIKTLEELREFSIKYGELVFSIDRFEGDKLEIYDEWRE